jgi:hypothetical protein
MSLKESSFTKLFYEILLRLDPQEYNEKIYNCLEKCVKFINVHLKLIKIDKYSIITHMDNARRVIGYDAILNTYVHSEDPRVRSKSKAFMRELMESQIKKPELIEALIIEDFLGIALRFIDEELENIAIDTKSVARILGILSLVDDFWTSFQEAIRVEEIREKSKQMMAGTGGSESVEKMLESNYARGFGDMIKLKVNNSVRKALTF